MDEELVDIQVMGIIIKENDVDEKQIIIMAVVNKILII